MTPTGNRRQGDRRKADRRKPPEAPAESGWFSPWDDPALTGQDQRPADTALQQAEADADAAGTGRYGAREAMAFAASPAVNGRNLIEAFCDGVIAGAQ